MWLIGMSATLVDGLPIRFDRRSDGSRSANSRSLSIR